MNLSQEAKDTAKILVELWNQDKSKEWNYLIKMAYGAIQSEILISANNSQRHVTIPIESIEELAEYDLIHLNWQSQNKASVVFLEALRDAVANKFGESKGHSQEQNSTMPKLNLAQWQFLSVLATAHPDFLTKHNEQVYYIKPELNGDNTKIIGFEGFTPEFYPSHKEQLSIPPTDFFKLVPRYLKKARHGNYYINAETIATDVQAYQASLDDEIEPTNQIFSTPSDASQFQCDIFMVMPFREHLDPVYTDNIKPIAENLGLKILRGDDPFSHNDIMHEVWSMINNARLIIADCTEKNPNVFYELGMAHTLGKPAIMITQNIDDIPFDVRGKRAIVYSTDSMKEFEEKLKTAIESILG